MFIYKGVFTIWVSSKILTQKGVFENFKRRGVLRKNLCKCTGIKNKYACIHYIMMFKRIFFKGRESLIISTPKRGVFENFERKKEGSLKIFEDPPFFSRGGSLKLWTLPNISKLLLIKMITDRITNRRRPQQYSQLLKSIWSKKAASLGVFISLLKCCPPVKAVGDLQKNY